MKRDELRAVARVLAKRELDVRDYLFASERGAKLTRNGFWRVVSEAGKRAGLPVATYTHPLRHACGYYLANKGCDLRLIQEYLGHRQIQNTVRYTTLSAERLRGLW